MLALIPLLLSTIGGAVGWKLGRPFGVFTGALLALIGLSLGFYYGRKLRKAATP
jgi:hypothetical protein